MSQEPTCTVQNKAGVRCTRRLRFDPEVCNTHLARRLRHGTVMAEVPIRPYTEPPGRTLLPPTPGATAVERFWNRVEKGPGCWLWTGGLLNSGYGQARLDGINMCAHRASFELTHGYRPNGRRVRQTCRNKLCVNPEHLVPW